MNKPELTKLKILQNQKIINTYEYLEGTGNTNLNCKVAAKVPVVTNKKIGIIDAKAGYRRLINLFRR